MQYALVIGTRMEAHKKLQGYCECCNERVIPKCGRLKVHHWAHKNKKDCDSWHEPETEWHRNWKNYFPEEFREVKFQDKNTGEFHRADIHTNQNVTLEFQNSPISIEELKSREALYQKLIWVINADRFRRNLCFTNNIPHPDDPLLRDFEFAGKVLFLKKEVEADEGCIVYGYDNPYFNNQLKKSYSHWAFEWKHKHEAWYEASSPVLIDLGHEFLYRLRKRIQLLPYWYIQVIKKKDFIEKYGGSLGG